MEKDLNLFFSDVIKKHTLTEEQALNLQKMFFPGLDENPNKALMESVKDMTTAYLEWSAAQAKKPKPQEKAKPMTDAEIEALASMF
jgi:hypothetical protein